MSDEATVEGLPQGFVDELRALLPEGSLQLADEDLHPYECDMLSYTGRDRSLLRQFYLILKRSLPKPSTAVL